MLVATPTPVRSCNEHQNQSRSRQHFPPEQKAAFFALLDELQNNTAVARQLGMNPTGTYNWLRKRGLRSHGKTGSGPHPSQSNI